MAKRRTRKRKADLEQKIRRAIGALVALLVIYGGIQLARYMMYESDEFHVREVEVRGLKYLDRNLIIDSIYVDKNQTMFDVNLSNVTDRILRNPYIRGVTVSRMLPATLLIEVQEREPLFYLVDKQVNMVDETGIILPKLPNMPMGRLPIVSGMSASGIAEDKVALDQTLALIDKIREVDLTLMGFISEINISDPDFPQLYLIKGGARVVLGDSHHYSRLFVLSEFLNKQPILGRLPNIKRIDLSFRDRIIVKNKT